MKGKGGDLQRKGKGTLIVKENVLVGNGVSSVLSARQSGLDAMSTKDANDIWSIVGGDIRGIHATRFPSRGQVDQGYSSWLRMPL